jgi:hypothetical protein
MDDRFRGTPNAVIKDIVLNAAASSHCTSSIGGTDDQWTVFFISEQCEILEGGGCTHWVAARRNNGAVHEGYNSGLDIWNVIVHNVPDNVKRTTYDHLAPVIEYCDTCMERSR